MTRADLPVIDGQRCTACGACIDICPERVLSLGPGGTVERIGEACMLCGHCAAICPVEAVVLPGCSATLGLKTIAESRLPTERVPVAIVDLLSLMRQRRSCRRFTAEPVDSDILADLARIGTTAPSGTNDRPWRFVILPERSGVVQLGAVTADFYRRLNRKAANPLYRIIDRLITGGALTKYYHSYLQPITAALLEWQETQVDRLFHGAPAVIIVAADNQASCPAEDALLATQNMLLAAQALDLGTCLIGFVVEAAKRDRRIMSLLGLGVNERVYSVIACGHPAVTFRRPAMKRQVEPRIVCMNEQGVHHGK